MQALVTILALGFIAGVEETPYEIIDRIDRLLRGESSHGRATMEVVTEHWVRSLPMEMWSLGTEYSLVRIVAPAKEAGTATLRAGGLRSTPFLRGELQVLGRDETAVQGSYQVHPLLRLAGCTLVNLDDGSALFSPSFAFSASDEATLSGGLFFGVGEAAVGDRRGAPLEYGLVPTTAYVSVSWFF